MAHIIGLIIYGMVVFGGTLLIRKLAFKKIKNKGDTHMFGLIRFDFKQGEYSVELTRLIET